MKNPSLSGVMTLLAVGLVLVSQTLFTVHQVELGLVVELGKPVRSIKEPGLHVKIPFLQEVHKFDNRLLEFEQDPQEVLSSDKKNLRVDNYARWRIVDPQLFYQTLQNENGAKARLNDIIYSNLREALGQHTMMEIVAGARIDLMRRIQEQANKQVSQYGIEIVDVRIKRTDLPAENSKAVYRRMQTERERQAKQYRAEGEEEAVKIRSKADRDREVILAEAYRESQMLRGSGDATAARIYAEAYRKNPGFYEFLRSLDAYRKALGQNSTMVMGSDHSDFLRFFSRQGKD